MNLILLGLALGRLQRLFLYPEVLVMDSVQRFVFQPRLAPASPPPWSPPGASCWCFGLGSWLATRRHFERTIPGLIADPGAGRRRAGRSRPPSRPCCRAAPGCSCLSSARLWLFVAVANLTGLVPGLHSPTSDLSTTAALAFLVFLSVHWYRHPQRGPEGLPASLSGPQPDPAAVSSAGRVFPHAGALAVRLFGNIMSLEMAALLVLLVAGLLVPVPVLMLHIVEALVQAYIFGTLALIYIAGGMQSREAAEAIPIRTGKEART
ncbi:MAG: F0F1 ATP synthase subunit A [Comamonadaceae bacterium]|nr:F0F1 ATP synthase subunit A [Comamonadaceae bacterium]